MTEAGFPPTLRRLVEELERLPGVGPKTAQRLAFHLLHRPLPEVERLADAIRGARQRVRECGVCGGVAEEEICPLCASGERDPGILCVVEEARDVVAMERSRRFRGRYHVLGGALSPLDGVGPEQLRIAALLERVRGGGVREVIVATDPDAEGEATALYLARLLKPLGVRVTRIARGLPEGSDLDYADDLTLAMALEGRREI